MEKLRFKLLLLLMVCIICSAATVGFGSTNCKEVERNALLRFKHSFIDGRDLLDSWVGQDCCNWKGVLCSNLTGFVTTLNLGSESFGPISYSFSSREVNPALLELKFLRYLDLSLIHFNHSRIPQFLGSMTQLQHLNLSVPQNLGNLTKLVSLDLSDCDACKSNSLGWASKLGNLQYLDLSGTDLSQATDSLSVLLHTLPSLLVLKLEGCDLRNSDQAIRNSSISSSPLQDLALFYNSLGGPFPSSIQNFSSITYLDLSHNQLSSVVPLWLGNQFHLKELNLGCNFLTGSFPPCIQNLSSIESIDLSCNSFNSSLPSWISSKNLKHLQLTRNSFNGPFPQFIQNSSHLKSIELSDNQFTFSIPSWLANNRELELVDLSNNHFNRVDGGISTIGQLCSLIILDLSSNPYQAEVSESQSNFSRCAIYNLEELYLSGNSTSILSPIFGSFSSHGFLRLVDSNLDALPLFSGSLSALELLDLSNNNLSTVPPTLRSLISLQDLYLSYNNLETIPPFLGSFASLSKLDLSSNHLSDVHQVSLANLSSLTYLDMSSNSLVLNVSPDWRPPFHLEYLNMLPCKLNGPFPKWLLSQEHISELDLSDTGIVGPLPDNIGNAMPTLQILRLANNHINGSIPKSLCELTNLNLLDLRKNRLSGWIPDCWESSWLLLAVELSSNTLSGSIPNSLTEVRSLQLLSLANNSLQGELNMVFTSTCERLEVLDVGRNHLQGEIPPWNGATFPSLQILILRENRLEGMIPPQLCLVHTLQVIDLAQNDLIGNILQCFGQFQGMGSFALGPSPTDSFTISVSPDEWSAMEVIKGEEREYTSVLHLLVNLDLSCNNLVGVIPTNLTSLSLLIGLNLSHNQLTGPIPKEIGKMMKLESLDLSSNHLSGSIPESLSSLTSLSKMNLSFNNLRGQIPTGHQLQVLDDPASIYCGNPGLCGDPLPTKCFGEGIAQTPTSLVNFKDEDKHEKMLLYVVIMLGFASGFWAVIGILVVKRRWRHAYFGLAEEIGDWLYVRVTLWIARSKWGKVNAAQASRE
ncbi:hypothetical protein V2J09_008372 [Rumex salicifolius]